MSNPATTPSTLTFTHDGTIYTAGPMTAGINESTDISSLSDSFDQWHVSRLQQFSRTALMQFGVNPGLGRTKCGSIADEKAAAHIASFEVINAVYEPHVRADPSMAFTKNEAECMVRLINHESNMRIKSTRGNLFGTGTGYPGDRELDSEIRSALLSTNTTTSGYASTRLKDVCDILLQGIVPQRFKERFLTAASHVSTPSGGPVIEPTARLDTYYGRRDNQVVASAMSTNTAATSVATGDLRTYRSPAGHVPSYVPPHVSVEAPAVRLTSGGKVDGRSEAIRNGDLFMKDDSTVDKRSSICRSGDVFTRIDGQVDGRSRAVRSHLTRTPESKTPHRYPVSTTAAPSPAPSPTPSPPAPTPKPSSVDVSSYTRANGVHVAAHTRSPSSYASSSSSSNRVAVSSYTRSSGTHVAGYSRRK